MRQKNRSSYNMIDVLACVVFHDFDLFIIGNQNYSVLYPDIYNKWETLVEIFFCHFSFK